MRRSRSTDINCAGSVPNPNLRQPPDVASPSHRRVEERIDDRDASSLLTSVAPSASTFAPLCWRARANVSLRHIAARAQHLVGRNRRTEAGAVDHDGRVSLRRAQQRRPQTRRYRDSPPDRRGRSQVVPPGPRPRRCCTIAAFSASAVWSPIADRANRRGRSQICRLGIGAFANDRDTPCPQRVVRERRDVTTGDQDDRAAGLEHVRRLR